MELKRKKKKQQQEFKRSTIAHFLPKSQVSEQYRSIRTALQFASRDQLPLQVIAITSASSNEGKSTTTANLATTFADQNYKVLLIDANLRNPSCHYKFKVPNQFGLTNVLLGVQEFVDVMMPTCVANLHLLTSGPAPANPTELLGMNYMDRLMKEVRCHYDYIFIDTPPVLDVTDTQIIGAKSDGIILVASSGRTKIDKAKKAKQLLLKSRGNLIGVVLNHAKVKQ